MYSAFATSRIEGVITQAARHATNEQLVMLAFLQSAARVRLPAMVSLIAGCANALLLLLVGRSLFFRVSGAITLALGILGAADVYFGVR